MPPPPDSDSLPTAEITPTPPPVFRATRLWWVTLACLVLAIALVIWAGRPGGLPITIDFHEGHGLKTGDVLRYRGIEVGHVRRVSLLEEADGIRVDAILGDDSRTLAREGLEIWVVRPQLSLARVRGLETVVGARYLRLRPASEPGSPVTSFRGLDSPPTLDRTAPLRLQITFEHGQGLQVGDRLLHRGIAIGEVSEMVLLPDLSGVRATVQLVESARTVARAGSLFWIEHPRVSLRGVRGLDTLVGGRHLSVHPGPEGAEAQTIFQGLAEPPPILEQAEGALEIVLEASERQGLAPGSPVTYRGISVGHVAAVGLASDSATVEARARIRPRFRHLVRGNSRFWSISGVEVELGFTGVRMSMESLQTVAGGGVAFRTGDPPGEPATTGKRFRLAAEPDDEWLTWEPRLAVGTELLPAGKTLPAPARASLEWSERNVVGLLRDRQRLGWILPLEDSRLLGLDEMLTPVPGAHEDVTHLAVEGTELALDPGRRQSDGALTLYTPATPLAIFEERWPLPRLRAPEQPEDALLWTGPGLEALPLSESRFAAGEETDPEADPEPRVSWQLAGELVFEESWHGAPVIARRDGALIGFLVLDETGHTIAPLTPRLLDSLETGASTPDSR